MYFIVCGGLSNDDVGAARGAVFQKIRPVSWELVPKPAISTKVAGDTVDRLNPSFFRPPICSVTTPAINITIGKAINDKSNVPGKQEERHRRRRRDNT